MLVLRHGVECKQSSFVVQLIFVIATMHECGTNLLPVLQRPIGGKPQLKQLAKILISHSIIPWPLIVHNDIIVANRWQHNCVGKPEPDHFHHLADDRFDFSPSNSLLLFSWVARRSGAMDSKVAIHEQIIRLLGLGRVHYVLNEGGR